jgi:hypothetical protein
MNTTENQQETNTQIKPKGKPFLIRVVGIATVVMGVIGSLFFAALISFLLTDAEFAIRFQQTYYNMGAFGIYLGSALGLHLLLIITGIFIFRLKKNNHWIFLATSTGLMLLSLMIDQNLLWTEAIITFVFFIILFSYRHRLN